jgi:hypothetical protein
MSKLLLTSVLIANLAIPLMMARDPLAVRGLKRTLLWVAAFNAFYLFGLVFVYPRL